MKRHLSRVLLAMTFAAAGLLAQGPVALDGKWEGALVVGPTKLRLVLNISKASDGLYLGTMSSVDQGNIPIPMDKIDLTGDAARIEVRAVNGVYTGTLSADKTKLQGTWSQGGPASSVASIASLALIELERHGAEISYVRTTEGFEVDFIARHPEGGRQLIQVCADLDASATRERETRALLAAGSEHKDASLHLISLAPEVPRGLPPGITWHSASMWLLEQR
jgi:hypothetical protein